MLIDSNECESMTTKFPCAWFLYLGRYDVLHISKHVTWTSFNLSANSNRTASICIYRINDEHKKIEFLDGSYRACICVSYMDTYNRCRCISYTHLLRILKFCMYVHIIKIIDDNFQNSIHAST